MRPGADEAGAGQTPGPGARGARPLRPAIRIVADDLTGALDTAAQFTGAEGSLPVLLRPGVLSGNAALDSGLREATPEIVQDRREALVQFLAPAKLAYLKIDSLLRGHSLSELAEVFRMGSYERCILAPAFPAQERATRQGIQWARAPDGAWRAVGPSMAEALRARGVPARSVRSASDLSGGGILVCDAESEAELDAVAATGLLQGGRLLWCGSAGLARALAGHPPVPSQRPSGSLLAIVGSIHPRSRAQLEAVARLHGELVVELCEGELSDPAHLSGLLAARGAAVLGFRFATAPPPPDAMRRIRDLLEGMLRLVRRPGTILVSGGETLRAACEAVRAGSLVVSGELQPGFPMARLVGGVWDGLPVISKSGAFGDAAALVDLVAAARPQPLLLGESA